MAPFPQRSRPGLLIQAACGGLHPAPASRVREASLLFSHLLRRLLRHTDVGYPDLVPPCDGEFTFEKIGYQDKRLAAGDTSRPILVQRSQVVLAHETRHAMLAAGLSRLPEVQKDPWRTVDAMAGDERRPNEPQQAGIFL